MNILQEYRTKRAQEMVIRFHAITGNLEMAKACAKLAVQEVQGVRPNVPYQKSSSQYEEAEAFWKAMHDAIDEVVLPVNSPN